MLPGHRELEGDGLQVPAPDDPVGREGGGPPVEALLELGGRGEGRVVVELEVRHDRDLCRQLEHRPVRLVALDDEPAVSGACVAAQLWDLAPDEERGIVAQRVEAVGDHRSSRCLPMRAGDHDRPSQCDELGEQLRPAATAYPPGVGRGNDGLRAGGRLGRLG